MTDTARIDVCKDPSKDSTGTVDITPEQHGFMNRVRRTLLETPEIYDSDLLKQFPEFLERETLYTSNTWVRNAFENYLISTFDNIDWLRLYSGRSDVQPRWTLTEEFRYTYRLFLEYCYIGDAYRAKFMQMANHRTSPNLYMIIIQEMDAVSNIVTMPIMSPYHDTFKTWLCKMRGSPVDLVHHFNYNLVYSKTKDLEWVIYNRKQVISNILNYGKFHDSLIWRMRNDNNTVSPGSKIMKIVADPNHPNIYRFHITNYSDFNKQILIGAFRDGMLDGTVIYESSMSCRYILNYHMGVLEGRQQLSSGSYVYVWYADIFQDSKYVGGNYTPVCFRNNKPYDSIQPGDVVYKAGATGHVGTGDSFTERTLHRPTPKYAVIVMQVAPFKYKRSINSDNRVHWERELLHPVPNGQILQPINVELMRTNSTIVIPYVCTKYRTNHVLQVIDIHHPDDPLIKYDEAVAYVFNYHGSKFIYKVGQPVSFDKDCLGQSFPCTFNASYTDDCGAGIHFHKHEEDCYYWF